MRPTFLADLILLDLIIQIILGEEPLHPPSVQYILSTVFSDTLKITQSVSYVLKLLRFQCKVGHWLWCLRFRPSWDMLGLSLCATSTHTM
jgi:hypothetical protein